MIKPLLEKSRQSMQTAEMLVKQNYYPSTVNRAYYACLQYILHILIEKLGHTHEYIKSMPRTGTHAQAQYLIELELISRVGSDKTDYKWFQEKFPAFKQERVIADYYGDALSQTKGYDSIKMADSIINRLNKYFNN